MIQETINIRELRIGNWVLNTFAYNGEQEYMQIEDLLKDEDLSDLKPIPLTSDILLKAGFEEFQGVLYYKADEPLSLEYKSYLGRVSWLSLNVMGEEYSLEHIKHLHTLQNAIFALTGTELKIDL